jgi:hypothetical protein
MREAGIARTGHTRLPSAARGAQLPAFQGSLVRAHDLTVLTKRLQSFAPRRLAPTQSSGARRRRPTTMRSQRTSREAVVPSRLPLSPVVPPPPCPSAHANRPGSPVSSTPDAQAHVELPPRVGVTQRPSSANEQRLRPDASDDALRSPQGLHQVVNQGWVAYFDCHCRCHAPRVAAGEARTSHCRQKRSAVKAAAAARRALTDRSGALVCDKTPASRTSRHRKPLWAPMGLGVFMELAEERVSHAISPRDPVRDDETRRESRARASYSKRGSAPRNSASISMHPNGPRRRERAPGRRNRSDRRSAGLRSARAWGRAHEGRAPKCEPSRCVSYGR